MIQLRALSSFEGSCLQALLRWSLQIQSLECLIHSLGLSGEKINLILKRPIAMSLSH
jgi:hypothetical protein